MVIGKGGTGRISQSNLKSTWRATVHKWAAQIIHFDVIRTADTGIVHHADEASPRAVSGGVVADCYRQILARTVVAADVCTSITVRGVRVERETPRHG